MQKYFAINQDGLNIRCKLYFNDPKSIRRAVVFAHGFGGHKDNKAAERFADRVLAKYKGVAVCTFDWPCHGDDVGKKLRLDDCDAYLTHVLAYLRETYSMQTLYAYGTSFGGYLLLKYLRDHDNPFEKIALRCPAVNMHCVLTRSIMEHGDADKLTKGKEILLGFDRKVRIDAEYVAELAQNDLTTHDFLDVSESILILHGTKDEIVPCEDSRAFADANLIEFIAIEGADHRFRDPLKMDAAISEILKHFQL